MYAAKSTARFCIISTVVLRGQFWCFVLAVGGNDLDLERK